MLLIRNIFILLVAIASIIGPYTALLNSTSSVSLITIEKGDSMYGVISKLVPNSLLNRLFFRIYIKQNQIESFKAGEYDISQMTIAKSIDAFNKGDSFTRSLQINEGITIFDLDKIINDSLLINDCLNLNCLKTDYPFKEGVLYPDTYFYKKGMKASEILKVSHEILNNKLTNLWDKKPQSNMLKNKFEALILASVIEKEAGNHLEKKSYSWCIFKKN